MKWINEGGTKTSELKHRSSMYVSFTIVPDYLLNCWSDLSVSPGHVRWIVFSTKFTKSKSNCRAQTIELIANADLGLSSKWIQTKKNWNSSFLLSDIPRICFFICVLFLLLLRATVFVCVGSWRAGQCLLSMCVIGFYWLNRARHKCGNMNLSPHHYTALSLKPIQLCRSTHWNNGAVRAVDTERPG